jgi:hypothetical protein
MVKYWLELKPPVRPPLFGNSDGDVCVLAPRCGAKMSAPDLSLQDVLDLQVIPWVAMGDMASPRLSDTKSLDWLKGKSELVSHGLFHHEKMTSL